MCGGLSSHVVRVLLECDVRTPEHVRARKKHFPHASVKKNKCAQTKTSSKKTQKTFLEVALARETNFVLTMLFTCLLPPRNFPQKQPPVFF